MLQVLGLSSCDFLFFFAIFSCLLTRSCCTKKDLQSLIGRLHHACMVVWSGRTFLRWMIDLLSCFCNDSHPICLNMEFRKGLAWWVEFFGQWNGISFFLSPTLEPLPDFSVSSDASDAIGYGAFMDNEWFNGRWSTLQLPLSVAYKDLFSGCFSSPCLRSWLVLQAHHVSR